MPRVIALQPLWVARLWSRIADALRRCGIKWSYFSSTDRDSAPPDVGDGQGLIVLGGPFRVYCADRYPFVRTDMEVIRHLLELGKPVLGICLGSQMLAAALGARVRAAEAPEIGWLPIRLEAAARDDPLLHDLPKSFVTCIWHGDVFDLPPHLDVACGWSRGDVPLSPCPLTSRGLA